MTKEPPAVWHAHELCIAIVNYVEASVAGRSPRIRERDAITLALVAVIEHLQDPAERVAPAAAVPPDQLCERLECEHPLSLHIPIETPRTLRKCQAIGCACSYWQMPENAEPGRTPPDSDRPKGPELMAAILKPYLRTAVLD